jgi:tetratricopeptide (TPR) repeat protein
VSSVKEGLLKNHGALSPFSGYPFPRKDPASSRIREVSLSARRASPWARVHFRLAESLEAWGWLTGAGWAYHDALTADPEYADAHYRLGEVLVRQKRWSEADRALHEAVRLHPFNMEAHGNLVLALFKQGSLSEATRGIERMSELRPYTAELHLVRGALLRRRSMHGEAIRAFRFAATLDPDPRAARFMLGAELLGAQEWATLIESHRDARAAHGVHVNEAPRNSAPRSPRRDLRVRERARASRRARSARTKRSPVAVLAALYHVVSGKTRVLLGRPHEAIRAFRQAHDALYERRGSRHE